MWWEAQLNILLGKYGEGLICGQQVYTEQSGPYTFQQLHEGKSEEEKSVMLTLVRCVCTVSPTCVKRACLACASTLEIASASAAES